MIIIKVFVSLSFLFVKQFLAEITIIFSSCTLSMTLATSLTIFLHGTDEQATTYVDNYSKKKQRT